MRLWLSEIRGWSERTPTVQISVQPYKPDPSRFLVTFSVPSSRQDRRRVRRVSPPGLDATTIDAWAKSQTREVYAELTRGSEVKKRAAPVEPAPIAIHTPPLPPPAPKGARPKQSPIPDESQAPTLAEFWDEMFSSRHVNACKPATQRAYISIWCNYIGPVLGKYRMDRIDRAALVKLRERMSKIPEASSRNQVLYKLRTIFETAVTWDVLDESQVPRIKMDKEPKKPDPVVYTESEAEQLLGAAGRDQESLAMVLLLLHGGLRVSEVCALRWSDVDFRHGLMTIAHNYSAGVDSTPKGGVAAPVGLSPALAAVLRELPRRGEHVLMRTYKGELCPLTPHAVRGRLNALQKAAGLAETGPHLLRHTGITLLAERGLDPWKLQAHARHARIATTQRYVHLAKKAAVLEAAAVWAPVAQAWPTEPRDSKKKPRAKK